ncbi:MAG: 23S rRNA (adenine(2503)-C(2))-methyltransferase RlmN [Oscillospiraceae bacterium]|jgi:23S rRNA (adenine2503-C2)-methyltransferase|nr:23S rRNA (adenine(2503)-C(2))-methyltransferase RlmN [Oscillospiraceae bacterium]
MTEGQVELAACTPEELRALLPEAPAYRAGQVFRWLQKGVRAFDEMTDLPLPLRERLAALGCLTAPRAARRQTARDGTEKILWRLSDGQGVESVFMRYRHGNTVCLSTQAGCRQGCAFCASTVGGLIRNLTAGEMLAQVTGAAREVGAPVSGVVLMGIGEPLDNLDEVERFVRLLAHPDGLHMSPRRVSLSTCGLIDGIDRLAALALPLTLSVSLHAADDETRTRLMPGNPGVSALLDACRRYFKATGRRVSYEYILLRDVNDTEDRAHLLGRLLAGAPAHVNLIPYNPTGRGGFQPSRPDQVRRFAAAVASHGPSVTSRRRLGQEIDAACGQLRRQTGQNVVQ